MSLKTFLRKGRTWKKYVVVSDVHVPSQDVKANSAVCDFLRDFKADGLVINGDFLDLVEISRHSTASLAQLEGLRIAKTFQAANNQLDQYQAAAGAQCKDNYFLDGNHEYRLGRWLEQGDNAVWLGDDAVSIEKRLKFKERGFKYHPGYPDGVLHLGHLLITHGRWCSKYSAATHLERYGHSVLVGHTHVPGMHYGSGFDKQRAGFCAGHLADISKPAMRYAPRPNRWSHGFAVVYVEASGAFHVQLINFVNNVFFYGGKKYGGVK